MIKEWDFQGQNFSIQALTLLIAVIPYLTFYVVN